jgi:hypothetical protein
MSLKEEVNILIMLFCNVFSLYVVSVWLCILKMINMVGLTLFIHSMILVAVHMNSVCGNLLWEKAKWVGKFTDG